MNAVVNDSAVVGESSIVAAMAFVKAQMVIPPRTLVAGIPAKVDPRADRHRARVEGRGHASNTRRSRSARSRRCARSTPLAGARARPQAPRAARAPAAVDPEVARRLDLAAWTPPRRAALANPLAEHVWRTRYRFEDEPSIDATLDRVARALAEAEPARPRALGAPFPRRARGFPLPARRPHPRRRGHRPPRHADELLRHGRRSTTRCDGIFDGCRGRDDACSRAAASATTSRRCGPRARRPTPPAADRSGPVSFMQMWEPCAPRCTRHEPAARRHDGRDGAATIRTSTRSSPRSASPASPRTSMCRCSSTTRSCARSRTTGRGSSRSRASALGAHDRARELWDADRRRRVRVGRARRAVHRPHPRRGQPLVLRDYQRDQSLRRDPAAAYGACDLGSINLAAFVRDPFEPSARLDSTRSADLRARRRCGCSTMSGLSRVSRCRRRRSRAVRRGASASASPASATRSRCSGCATTPRTAAPRRRTRCA